MGETDEREREERREIMRERWSRELVTHARVNLEIQNGIGGRGWRAEGGEGRERGEEAEAGAGGGERGGQGMKVN